MNRIAIASLFLLATLAACAPRYRNTEDIRPVAPEEPGSPAGEIHPQAGSDPLDESSQPTTDDGTTPVTGGATEVEETEATGGTSPSQRGSAFEPDDEEDENDEPSPDEIDPQTTDPDDEE